MKMMDFQNTFADYPIFSLQDVRKVIDNFSYRQLDRWEKNGYLKKIKRGYYCFTYQNFTLEFLFYTANRMYSPSYISLEKALKFYGLIPEEIFQITSVSTKKTTNFETKVGNFSYRHIKPALFWGYRLMDFDEQKILFAEPEKALLDYFYLKPQLKTADDFKEIRINKDEFLRQIDLVKLRRYLEGFKNNALSARTEVFLATLLNYSDL